MAALPIVLFPDVRLRQRARKVTKFTVNTAIMIRQMWETLEAYAGCVGLAAPQVGYLQRVIVVDVSQHKRGKKQNHGRLTLVNPMITASNGCVVTREGCLSIPDYTGNVVRAGEIDVEALDAEGAAITMHATGFEAVALQHEIDHLDGILFIDRLQSFGTDLFLRRDRRQERK